MGLSHCFKKLLLSQPLYHPADNTTVMWGLGSDKESRDGSDPESADSRKFLVPQGDGLLNAPLDVTCHWR